MLIRFKVSNFLSFDEPQELSMISGETRILSDHIHKFEDLNVLRTSAIYGANASGKSNLIKAFRESRQMIIMDVAIPSKRYFRLSETNKDKPSYFEFEFENDGRYYSYGFEFLLSRQSIVSEWLYGLESEGENRVFFQRVGNKIEHGFKGDDKVRMDIYAEDMKSSDRTLFLREMYKKMRQDEKDLSVFSDVYVWFSRKVKIFGAEAFPCEKMNTEEKEKETVRLLEALGTGITGVGYEQIEITQYPSRWYPLDDIREDLIREKKKDPGARPRVSYMRGEFFTISEGGDIVLEKRVFRHGAAASFDMEEESEGTRRLYDLLEMMVSEAGDSVCILDGLDLKLHPQLTYRFLELFLEEKAGTKNQLIFTSHESSLIDFKLLRRDEIWFVQKRENGSTSLYSLEDFNERTDRKVNKAYLEGRYGGVPVFSAPFPISVGDKDQTCGK